MLSSTSPWFILYVEHLDRMEIRLRRCRSELRHQHLRITLLWSILVQYLHPPDMLVSFIFPKCQWLHFFHGLFENGLQITTCAYNTNTNYFLVIKTSKFRYVSTQSWTTFCFGHLTMDDTIYNSCHLRTLGTSSRTCLQSKVITTTIRTWDLDELIDKT